MIQQPIKVWSLPLSMDDISARLHPTTTQKIEKCSNFISSSFRASMASQFIEQRPFGNIGNLSSTGDGTT